MRRIGTTELTTRTACSSGSVGIAEPHVTGRSSLASRRERSVESPVQPMTTRRSAMNTYAILRRNGWRTAGDLEEAAGRSIKVADEQMPDDIRWIRSYVLEEDAGGVGTVCIYEASSLEAIRDHAQRADLPVDEIIPIADTVVVRPDPQPAAA
jgi:hypothetical protein